jgi:DNA-binding transcriptional MerR regulator
MVTNRLRPSDVARELGRSVSWLRILERRGIIEPAKRDALNGHRVYTIEDLEKIRGAVMKRRAPKPEAQGAVA